MLVSMKRYYIVQATDIKEAKKKVRELTVATPITPHVTEITVDKCSAKLQNCVECGGVIDLQSDVVFCNVCKDPMHSICSFRNKVLQPSCLEHINETKYKQAVKFIL